jgi:hypothetical protein
MADILGGRESGLDARTRDMCRRIDAVNCSRGPPLVQGTKFEI